MIYEIILFIIRVFLDPMIQLLLWGILTTANYGYTLVNALDPSVIDDSKNWRLVTAGLISVFWITGAFAWFASCMEWMIISDTVLTAIFLCFHKRIKQYWSMHIVQLGVIFICLDILFIYGLSQPIFAILSNIVFGRELYIVSGWANRIKNNQYSEL